MPNKKGYSYPFKECPYCGKQYKANYYPVHLADCKVNALKSKPNPDKLWKPEKLIIPAYFKHLQTYHAPTVNHMYWQEVRHVDGGKHQVILRLKPEAQTWFDIVKLQAKTWVNRTGWKIPEKQVFTIVEVFYYWKDNRFPDSNNTHKIILDALEGEIFQNDKFALVRDMGVKLDKGNPRIELNFRSEQGERF